MNKLAQIKDGYNNTPTQAQQRFEDAVTQLGLVLIGGLILFTGIGITIYAIATLSLIPGLIGLLIWAVGTGWVKGVQSWEDNQQCACVECEE